MASTSQPKPKPTAAERQTEKARQDRLKLLKLSKLPKFSWNNEHGLCGFTPPTRRVFTADDRVLKQELARFKKGAAVGFDMEWNFNKKSGAQKRTAVIQISDMATVLIFSVPRARTYRLPACLTHFLQDPTVYKLGVNIRADAQKLHRDWPNLLPPVRGLVELSELAKHVDADRWSHKPRLVSLQDLAAQYADVHLEKGDERCSNWELSGPWAPNAQQMSDRQLDCKCIQFFFGISRKFPRLA